MKRLSLLVVVALLASHAALGQTYVRPSKGAAFNPFATSPATVSLATTAQGCSGSYDGRCCDNAITNKDGFWPVLPDPTPSPVGVYYWCSAAYDWTAFDGAQVSVYSTASTNNIQGTKCSNVTPLSYTFIGLNNYVRFRLSAQASNGLNTVKSTILSVLNYTAPNVISSGYSQVSPLSNGLSGFISGNNTTDSVWGIYNNTTLVGCPIEMRVTPIPFTTPESVRITNPDSAPASVKVTNTTGYSTQVTNMSGLACDASGLTTSVVTGTKVLNPYLPLGANYAYVHVRDAGAQQPYYGYARVCSAPSNFMQVRCLSDTGTVGDILDYTKPGEYLSPGGCADFDKRYSVICTSQDPLGATFSLFSCNY